MEQIDEPMDASRRIPLIYAPPLSRVSEHLPGLTDGVRKSHKPDRGLRLGRLAPFPKVGRIN
ncbi:MAG: hypothetical protein CW342_15090 [Thermoactinomycetaceae bacterium]|nr:hypothetical protein [Thermoactinomycetaceae bacterium]